MARASASVRTGEPTNSAWRRNRLGCRTGRMRWQVAVAVTAVVSLMSFGVNAAGAADNQAPIARRDVARTNKGQSVFVSTSRTMWIPMVMRSRLSVWIRRRTAR